MSREQKCILTNMCLIYDDNKILVVDRKKKDWPGLTLPGGHIEKDENFIDSIKREVKEETGLTIKKPLLCGIEEFKSEEDNRYLIFFYKTNIFSGKLKSSNEGEVFWIEKEDLKKHQLSLDLLKIIKVMESDELSELMYYKKENTWLSKII